MVRVCPIPPAGKEEGEGNVEEVGEDEAVEKGAGCRGGGDGRVALSLRVSLAVKGAGGVSIKILSKFILSVSCFWSLRKYCS